MSFFFLFLCVSVFTQTDGHTRASWIVQGANLIGATPFWLLSHLTVLWVPPFFLLATEEITTIRIPPALSIKPNRKRNKSFYLFSGGENRKISEKRLWRRDTGCGGKKVRHDDLHRYPPIVFCFSSSCDSFFPIFQVGGAKCARTPRRRRRRVSSFSIPKKVSSMCHGPHDIGIFSLLSFVGTTRFFFISPAAGK